jgi:hypothetical protein
MLYVIKNSLNHTSCPTNTPYIDTIPHLIQLHLSAIQYVVLMTKYWCNNMLKTVKCNEYNYLQHNIISVIRRCSLYFFLIPFVDGYPCFDFLGIFPAAQSGDFTFGVSKGKQL